MKKDNVAIRMHNTYTIYKEVSGKQEKIACFTNIVLDAFYNNLCTNGGYTTVKAVWFGTGTAEPLPTDIALTKELWMPINTIEYSKEPYIAEDGSWNRSFVASIPATEEYTGTVTEVGVLFNTGPKDWLGTKALIKDAEGNPISITKTDTEKLLVEVHMQMQYSGPVGFKCNPYYNFLLDDCSSLVFIPNLMHFNMAMLATHPDNFSGGARIGNFVTYSKSYDKNNTRLVCSKGRFSTDNTPTQRYVNAIGLFNLYDKNNNTPCGVPFGWFEFPNQELFPNITLRDIPIGTGDGSMVSFKPPLNYWVKETEKVYIDGSLQVRGVDYTCDNVNNLDSLLELMPSSFCKLLNRVLKPSQAITSKRGGKHPLKGGYVTRSWPSDSNYAYLEWDKDHPLMWELDLDNPVGASADYFCMNEIYSTLNGDTPGLIRGTVFILSYSDDLETWTEAGRYTCPTNSSSAATYRFEFGQTITAKYWKLDTDVTNSVDSVKNGNFFTNAVSYLGRYGSPIVFTNPPAEGAIITMDADIDRPMKNSNFVIDCNPTLQF